jgi:hypothetical protein
MRRLNKLNYFVGAALRRDFICNEQSRRKAAPTIWILFLLILLGALVQVNAAEPIGGDFGDEPRIVVEAPKDTRFAHLAWPKIVKTGDGTLVLAYSAGRYHGNGGEGCPAVSISKDKGMTWSPPKILREFDQSMLLNNSANTALGVAEDGSVVLLAMAYTGDERNGIFGWRSTDSGDTWKPVDVSNLDEGKTGSVYGHIFEVSGKGLAVTGHYRIGSVNRTEGIWIAYSQDHGQSWGPPNLITDQKLFEPATVWTGDRFVGLFRDGASVPYYWQTVSDKSGENWVLSKWPEKQGDDYRLPSPFIIVSPKNPDRLFAFESRRAMSGNLPGRIYLWTADTHKLDWNRIGTVIEFPKSLGERTDITYPWMVHLEDDNWFLVFYCGQSRGPSSIYGMQIVIDR